MAQLVCELVSILAPEKVAGGKPDDVIVSGRCAIQDARSNLVRTALNNYSPIWRLRKVPKQLESDVE